ncbi:serine protease (plasmid) [Bacillus mycoides]|nr:serine protease [Bacillus mycoides]
MYTFILYNNLNQLMEEILVGYYDDRKEIKTKRNSNRTHYLIGITGLIIGGVIAYTAIFYISSLKNIHYKTKHLNSTAVTTSTKNNENNTTNMIESAQNSIVQVINYTSVNSNNKDGVAGTGSGVIYKTNNNLAYIITNNHVIQDAKRISVTFNNKVSVDAKLIGTDKWTDLAVLEVSSEHIDTIADFGESKNLKVGEQVFAIGNPLGLTGTVTSGIISSLKRSVPMDLNGDKVPDWEEELVQTDASINPGNSGGGLFNKSGQLIGINSSKISQASVEGIGFAIPIDTVKYIVQKLEQKSEIKRPTIGVQLRALSEITSLYIQTNLRIPESVKDGFVIIEVENDSPAFKSGLQISDVIVSIDDKPINTIVDMRKYIFSHRDNNKKIKITIYRQQNRMDYYITLK